MQKKVDNKIYLDVCVLCRPFDDQQSIRIRLETDAIYMILSKIHNRELYAVKSPVHDIELSAISNDLEKEKVLALISTFDSVSKIDIDKVRCRADALSCLGFGVADAAHLAYAENSAATFITCDDKLLRKSKKENMHISTYNPIDFVIKKDLK